MKFFFEPENYGHMLNGIGMVIIAITLFIFTIAGALIFL